MGRFANLAISPSNPPAWLRNSHTTRMLYTVLPSEAYAPNGVSTQSLMRALARWLFGEKMWPCSIPYKFTTTPRWNGKGKPWTLRCDSWERRVTGLPSDPVTNWRAALHPVVFAIYVWGQNPTCTSTFESNPQKFSWDLSFTRFMHYLLPYLVSSLKLRTGSIAAKMDLSGSGQKMGRHHHRLSRGRRRKCRKSPPMGITLPWWKLT